MPYFSPKAGILTLLLLIGHQLTAQKSLVSFSPNHQIVLNISIDTKGQLKL